MVSKLGSRFSFLTPPRVAFALILICGLLLFLRYPANPASYQTSLPADFAVYVQAWEWVRDGQNPYLNELRPLSPFKYSPAILRMIGWLPRSPAQAWAFFSSFCIITLMASLVIGASYRSWKKVGLLVIGLLLAWKGILETLDYGQLELIILFLAVSAAALVRRYPFFAGLLAGTLPWIKLPWIALGLPLLLACRDKKRRMLISGFLLSCFIWGAAIPSLTFGSERSMLLFQSWIGLLRHQPKELYFSDINQSVWISMQRWMESSWIGSQPSLAMALACILVGLVLWRLIVRLNEALRSQYMAGVFSWIAPWLLFVQLLNPLSWRWGSALLVGIPFAFFSGGTSTEKGEGGVGKKRLGWLRIVLFILVAVLWLLQLNPVVKGIGFQHWSELHAYGVVTGYWLALLLLSIRT